VPYDFIALLAVALFAAVHLWASRACSCRLTASCSFLSIGSGVAIAYVFIDLLPKLARGGSAVRDALGDLFPFVERHVYVMALLGFLLFYAVDRSETASKNRATYFFCLSLGAYALFNFLVGYAVVDKNNPEVQPLLLFTLAMALHYFMNDYTLTKAHGDLYEHYGRWTLISALFLGWAVGNFFQLSTPAVALVSAFIGGGVIMNVTRHELSNDQSNNLTAFIVAALTYMLILLALKA
jgi:hypothetical protein